jgi:hypothetical protein
MYHPLVGQYRQILRMCITNKAGGIYNVESILAEKKRRGVWSFWVKC